MLHVLLYDQKYQNHLRHSLLEISPPFPALLKREQYAPSCANISSEPSDRRQRQKCRFQCTGCLLAFALCHADMRQGFMPFSLSAHKLHARPPLLYMRAWDQTHTRICSVLSCDVFARVVRRKLCGRDRLEFFALPTARTRLPRTASCDSVAYAEGVQKRNPFLFLSFSYFSDRRKVPYSSCTFA